MALAIEEILGNKITAGHINVPVVKNNKLKRIKATVASHPIPNQAGVNGSRQIQAIALRAAKDDLVIGLFSGGGSALMPLPVGKLNLKEKSRSLRRQGFSLNEIVKELNVSKSTLSLWCRDIALNELQIISLEKRAQIKSYAGALKGAHTNHLKSQSIINKEKEKAQEFINKISNREICLIGTALYWAEGNKTGKTFGIVNSDPVVILVCMKWLSIEFDMIIDNYLPRMFINEYHKNREFKIKKYWSNITKIPISQFRNTVFIKSKHKKIFPNPSSYIGVIHLRVKKSSQILYRTLSQVQLIKDVLS